MVVIFENDMENIFGKVQVGKIFRDDEDFYIKTTKINSQTGIYNAVGLTDGAHYYFLDEEEVQLYNEFNTIILKKGS